MHIIAHRRVVDALAPVCVHMFEIIKINDVDMISISALNRDMIPPLCGSVYVDANVRAHRARRTRIQFITKQISHADL